MSTKTYRVTKVFVVQARSKDEAQAIANRPEATELVDYESIREVIVEKRGSLVQQFASEAARQLTGRDSLDWRASSAHKQEPRRQS